MSQKTAKRIRRLESRMDAMERCTASWDAAEAAVHNQAAFDVAAERRRARQAERTAAMWRRMVYAALVAAIIVEIIAILVVHASSTPVFEPNLTQIDDSDKVSEDFENERIEAALLSRAHVIEDCAITFYCNERYPHICGTGDGIAYDGTPALAWATCAVDPEVIPLGSTVMVDLGDGEGLRTLVANDTGVKDSHLDICVGSHSEADRLGKQTTTVYWCEEVS